MKLRPPHATVMKYYEPLERFVRIRMFRKDDLDDLLQPHVPEDGTPLDRGAYVQLVVRLCVVNYEAEVKEEFQRFDPDRRADLILSLYQACVDLNPRMDIHVISIPIHGLDGLEVPKPAVSEDRKKQGQQDRHAWLAHMENRLARLKNQIVGQPEALDVVSRSVRRGGLGLTDPDRPCACLLFAGPTGVGKTELAKCLSRDVLGDESLAKVDCSEYAMAHEYSKLIGSPPGFVGHEEGGWLTEMLAGGANRLVLFDEVEKADVRLHNLLLQVLDEGRLTSGKGETIDMTGSFLVLTSNAGTEELAAAEAGAGFRHSATINHRQRESIVKQAIEREFTPEFLNRLDNVVVFRSLTLQDIERITRLQIKQFRRRLIVNQEVRLTMTDAAIRALAKAAYSPVYGAREVRRTIQRKLIDVVAERLTGGEIKRGDACRVTARRGELLLKGASDG